MNLNGVEYEVGDAVLFANYFIFGPSIWDPIWFENQILGTNINDDGQLLTLADLQCLIHIIADADWSCTWLGNDNPTSARDTAIVGTDFTPGERIDVSTNSPSGVGAAAFMFRYAGVDIGKAKLADEYASMTISSLVRDGILRILVHSSNGSSIIPGKHQLFAIPITGDGTIELIQVQLSDAQGNALKVKTAK